MALTILDERIYGEDIEDVGIVAWWWLHVEQPPPDSHVTVLDVSRVTDSVDASPAFDPQHQVFTNPIVDNAGQNAFGDNTSGPEDPRHFEPTLTYTSTSGYQTTHKTSQAIVGAVTQDFSYEYNEGGVVLPASGTIRWSDGASDHTSGVPHSQAVPFDVPQGKIYEAQLLFRQEQVTVPYSLTVHVHGQGDIDFRWYNPLGYRDLSTDSSIVFRAVGQGAPAGHGVPVPPYKDVDWSDFAGDSNGHGTYTLPGTLTIYGASAPWTKVFDVTGGTSQAVRAEYDPAVPVGVRRTMDDAGRTFTDTPFDDRVDGGAGNDVIRFSGGEEIAHAGGGGDRIVALGVGRSLLDGGAGDDVIRLTSSAPYGTVLGGAGGDRIRVDAPAAMLYGGAGDDRYVLDGATAGGTVITDAEGRDRLSIDNGGVPLGFERLPHGEDLYILLGGGETYDRTRDVVWVDFFANPANRVGGLTTAEVADRATTFRPTPPPEASTQPTTAELINAAHWTYGRDEEDYPADLRPFMVDGQHLALEVTDHGFYGATFLTPGDQVIVAFEGTHLSAFDDDPVFAAAQVAADLQIYLGLVPDAYGDALSFTRAAIDAAALQGIGAVDVFVAGHSLGAAQAQYVAAQLDLAGQTYGGPGLAAEAIPTGATSRLVNFVEYGDPIGNYSADPDYLGGFLRSGEVLRFGEPTYIGDPLARLALEAAGGLFGPGTTSEQNAEGLAALAILTAEYHPLARYAADLGVTLDDPGAGDDAGERLVGPGFAELLFG